jgi:hypothetical protein
MASPPEDLLRDRLRPIEILAKAERRRKPPQDDRLSEDLARALNESTDERKRKGSALCPLLYPPLRCSSAVSSVWSCRITG